MRLCLFLPLLPGPALADEPSPRLTAREPETRKTLRVYFVGNSVTDTINYRALAALAKSPGHKQVWGRHGIPGAPSHGFGSIRTKAFGAVASSQSYHQHVFHRH